MASLARDTRNVTKTALDKVKTHMSQLYDQLKPRIPGEETPWDGRQTDRTELLKRNAGLARMKQTLKARFSNKPELTMIKIEELGNKSQTKLKKLKKLSEKNGKRLTKTIPPSEKSLTHGEKTV
jgi:hypothetical protein